MKFYILTILFLVISLHLFSQEYSEVVLKKYMPYDFEIDYLNNIYTIENNKISKYTIENNQLILKASYKSSLPEKIHTFDCSDPNNLMLFLPNFSKIIILDNFLTQKTVYDLLKWNIHYADAVCRTNTGDFWIYFAAKNQIEKYNQQGNRKLQTSPLPFFDAKIKLTYKNNRLIAYNNKGDLLIFNQFGQLIISEKIKNKSIEQVNDNSLVIKDIKDISLYDLKSNQANIIFSEKKTIKTTKLSKKYLYLHCNDSLILLKK